MNVGEKRGKRRPKKRWLETIENDMKAASVYTGNVKVRDK